MRMKMEHPQERVLEVLHYNGIDVELVQWSEATWCGKVGYASDNAGEPDVEQIMQDFMSIDFAQVSGRESGWDVCLSIDYLTDERPSGVMFAFLVDSERQFAGCDILKTPPALYMKLRICEETAKALDRAPWCGGIPPHEWIGEQIAPACGYAYGDNRLPIVEYYGGYDPEKNAHEYCFLYVPVKNAE